jgi:hypothetical protein
MNQTRTSHRYSAHLRAEGAPSRQWVVEADSFIDAAVLFAETTGCHDPEVAVVVTECETGKDRCFMVNLETGEIGAC